jgi:AAA15 family ATPase/GTPase
MRIKNISIQNFKRFTDLTISEIPSSAKLVLAIGSNGSGKSNLFDAFTWMALGVTKPQPYNESASRNYYRKDGSLPESVRIEIIGGEAIYKKGNDLIEGESLIKRFIGRSSNRIVPHLTGEANSAAIARDLDSPKTFIENDVRFNTDVYQYIQQINNALREPVFSGRGADTLKIFSDFIAPLNSSLLKIFGGDPSTTIQIAEFQDATNTSAAKLIFKKGYFENQLRPPKSR